jgi:hypothetical protein
MKREKIDIADIACSNNLAEAAYQAARGKRSHPYVKEFFRDFD